MKRWKRRSRTKKQKQLFLETGRTFLEELVADCNGKSNPIRMFSSDQILTATNNFDSSCSVSLDGHFAWYRGVIDDRVYAIKKYHSIHNFGGSHAKRAYNDIVVAIRVSSHSNFLKVLGCCLEFPLPVLVHEYPDNGALNNKNGANGGEDGPLLPWKLRVKIAKEIAYAVTYLHKAFPRIIIHRDIKPSKIFLDKDWTAKLTGFSVSISLPEGKSRVEDVLVGTYAYIDPRYMETGVVAESSDVFNFGRFLMVLLAGTPAFSIHEHPRMVHDYVKSIPESGAYTAETMNQMMAKDMTDHQRSQMEALRKLALRCCEDAEDDRPTMVQVAKELKQIETSLHAPCPIQTLQNI